MSSSHVVIVGGGFAGLRAAQALRKAPVQVTLVDRKNHHLFQPLLYQVASAALNPSDIAYPIRAALRKQQNVRTVLGEVEEIDVANKRVRLDRRTTDDTFIDYDYLVLATGATHSYFGNRQWQKHAPGLKTIEDALEIRRRVLLAFEAAERDLVCVHEWMTFVIVGAGPTGVELAGAFIDIARKALAKDFRSIHPNQARVILLEGGDRVLAAYPEKLSGKAQRQLERLGVTVRTNAKVTHIDDFGVEVDGQRINARTVLWAAGVRASPLAQQLGTPTDPAGRVLVEPDLSIPGHREVFVAGDLAALTCNNKPVPGVAPAALQGGKHAARCILNDLDGRIRQPFRYRDKGSLATIGRAAAVADLGRLKFSGFPAWITWMGVHIFFLVSFRNRVFVFFSWAWSYITFQRGARLITGDTHRATDTTVAAGPGPKPEPPVGSAPTPDACRQTAGTAAADPASEASSSS